jgi:hypothetical protein
MTDCFETSSLIRLKLISYLKPLIEVNPMSISIHISIFYLLPYIFSQLAMYLDSLLAYLNTNLDWMGKNGVRLLIYGVRQ